MKGKLIQWLVAAGASFVTYALGGWDVLLKVVLGVMLLDIITGISASIKERKRLSSAVAAVGLWRKFGYILAASLGILVDMLLVNEGIIDGPGLARNAVLYGAVVVELVSLGENFARLDVKLPGVITKIIDLFKDKENVDILPK